MEIHTTFSEVIAGTMRLGKWGQNFDTSQYRKFIEGCLELGVTSFDHADIYGDYTTEAEFGNVLKEAPQLREKMQIITKCGIRRVCDNRPNHKVKSYDSSAKHIVESVENSLRELNTDYLDVLLLHRPDYLMNPKEVIQAFDILKEQGKVKDFGVSNFSMSQFDILYDDFPLCTNQVEFSLVQPKALDDGTLDQCLTWDFPAMAWSPLGGGLLFSEGENEQSRRIKDTAKPLLEKYNCSLDQLLYAWIARHPANIIPVLGTSKLERVKTALTAMEIQMESEDWYALLQASTGTTIP